MTGDVEALNIRLNYLTRYIQHQRTEIKELEKRVRALEQQQKQARQTDSESRSTFLDSSVEDFSASPQRRPRCSPKKPVVRQKPVRPRTSPSTKPAKRRRRHRVIPSTLRIKRSSLPVEVPGQKPMSAAPRAPGATKDKYDVLLSKKLAWVLRHGAAKVGLKYMPGGFLYLDELLGLAKFRGVTEAEIRHVVDNNDKRRFEMFMDPESGRMKIRAIQGHSVQISNPAHTLITIPSEFPTVLHGTYFRNWEKIRTEGLKRMGRTHIHMAVGEPGDCGVISGVRANVEVLIYIDLARAMADGYRFYVTPNRVILTEGNTDGCLPPKYFKAAYQLRPRLLILQ
ncbi:hypothetical protein CRM22_008148 [Opisthorchis felineus]|uniref:2'-phosphotransferase n=1 Tax=Opisthorchis felineus TaxID=147828 RepID=A0A4S2LEM2_OPIFE|nr:hypothetical protein CRM22_008148 [Opisthorchis felineus]